MVQTAGTAAAIEGGDAEKDDGMVIILVVADGNCTEYFSAFFSRAIFFLSSFVRGSFLF